MAKVVHCKRGIPHYYIGRVKYSNQHFGNPFSHKDDTLASVRVGSLREAIQAFSDWLDGKAWQEVEPQRREWILANLQLLKGQNLGCWCAPGPCHGDVLLRLVSKLD